MEERLIKYIKNLTPEERLTECKKQAATALKSFKTKEKSLTAELNYNGARTGARGGKRTTLSAKASNDCQAYEQDINYLKLIIKYI